MGERRRSQLGESFWPVWAANLGWVLPEPSKFLRFTPLVESSVGVSTKVLAAIDVLGGAITFAGCVAQAAAITG